MDNLITRQEWNAAPPTHLPTKLEWKDIDAIAIHYSASMADEYPYYKDRVLGIQRYHQSTNGWNDIAYNFLVARNGDKFEGRNVPIQSAATLGHNDHTQAICFLGADQEGRDDVTDKGRRAISEFIFYIEDESGKKVIGVQKKHSDSPTGLVVSGHKVFTSTQCPGKELTAFISVSGWEAYRKKPLIPYPEHFFNWAAWWLGEGPYQPVGPRNEQLRPEYPKKPVTLVYWIALKQFLAARKKA